MGEQAVIDIDKNRAFFERVRTTNKVSNQFSIFVILVIVIAISIIVFVLEYNGNEYFRNMRALCRINTNFSSTAKMINDLTAVQVRRTIMARSLVTTDLTSYNCYDMGSYYVAGRINPESNLFEFIRRGKGSFHVVFKAAQKDIAAENYCQFLIQTKGQRDTLKCGRDMLDKLGYTDLFQKNSVCNRIIDVVYSAFS